MSCTICNNSTNYIELPCGHNFHLKCIKKIIKPFCPTCKNNIIDFLVENGSSRDDILKKISKNDVQLSCGNMHEEYDNIDLLKLIYMAKIRDSNWIFSYRAIITDRIANAGHLFSEISALKFKSGHKGVFMFMTTITDFVITTLSKDKSSPVSWININELETSPFHNAAIKLIDRIKNVNTDYGLLIVLIDNTLDKDISTLADPLIDHFDIKILAPRMMCPRLMSTDPEQKKKVVLESKNGPNCYIAGLTTDRPAYSDAVTSLRKANFCRHSGHSENDINPECDWAINYLNNMKQFAG